MKGYRTLLVNLAVALGTALVGFLGTPEVQAAFASHPQYLVVCLAVLNIGLRLITNSPVGSKA